MIDTGQLQQVLRDLGTPRVLVVGDLMLDRYVSGEVSRISPEAPIPVLTAQSAEEKLGGAGNVARNLAVMGAEVHLVGVIGDDGWGRALRSLLEEEGITSSGLVVEAERPTSLKTRMVSGVQQMLRVDWEDSRELSGGAHAALLDGLAAEVERAGAVVISDYGKGVISSELLAAVIAAGRAARVPVLVDPKGSDYTPYRGATLITPNRKEAERALGRQLKSMEAVAEGARELLEQLELDATLITLGSGGIYFRSKDGTDGHEPTVARAVFDVTGAGDTVVAHLALYLAADLDLAVAVALANQAAGVVVARLGTNAVDREELRARLRGSALPEGKCIASDEELHGLLNTWRSQGRRVVFTNGCFDIIHSGHVNYLRFARSRGDVLIVGLNDDASVARLKGPERPINTLGDRCEVLAALEMVDAVVAFGEDTPAQIIERISPDVLVKGEDWKDKGVVGREWVEKHGGQVVLAPLVEGRSTTSILDRARGKG
ncbi:MAG TPA: D-glycero-beta-D-manno-heptose-7-phosphate kinase [Planctomycetes bacterium]|nr:D-glycero-beta-D-manno-heptose-7-phosphate kinase [Planctomycetota bacterium]HIL52914.1 D-glycero-beta-D-manno-heptose-7-phosphate kinase [Planctomycetota bacterium]